MHKKTNYGDDLKRRQGGPGNTRRSHTTRVSVDCPRKLDLFCGRNKLDPGTFASGGALLSPTREVLPCPLALSDQAADPDGPGPLSARRPAT